MSRSRVLRRLVRRGSRNGMSHRRSQRPLVSITALLVVVFLTSLMPTAVATTLAAPRAQDGSEIAAAAAPITPVTLGFDADVAGTIADKDGQGTGFTSVQPIDQLAAICQAQPRPQHDAPGTLDITTTTGISSRRRPRRRRIERTAQRSGRDL